MANEPRCYRIRVGKLYFKQSVYVTKIAKDGEVFVDGAEPKEWKHHNSAYRLLPKIKEQYPSAEVETTYLN